MPDKNRVSDMMAGMAPEGYYYLSVKVSQIGYGHILVCETCGCLVGNTVAHNVLCEYGKAGNGG